MEKLVALSDLFGVSLDELVTGKCLVDTDRSASNKPDVLQLLEEHVLTSGNKEKLKKGFKIATVIACGVLTIDLLTMVVYFLIYGIPK